MSRKRSSRPAEADEFAEEASLTEEQTSHKTGSKGRKIAKKAGRFALKAADATIDTAAFAVSSVFRVIGTVFITLFIAGLLFACIFAYYIKTSLTPQFDLSLDDYRLNQSSTIWYKDAGGEWRTLVNLTGTENRVWVDYDDIPEYMEHAVVAIEDKRFYQHKGVDWYRTSGAFVQMFATMQNSYGGSTITQQLIKNLTGNDEITVQRKLMEMFGALELEKKYDKKEIIEWYLNAVYFGEGCYGVETAAETYFGKDVSELSLAECAAIVGITNMPTYYDPFYNEDNNKERQETILREMYEQSYISYSEYKDACAEELVFTHAANTEAPVQIYSFYEETVIDDVIHDLMQQKGIGEKAARTLVFNGGYQIYCCLDPIIQSYVDSIYQDLSQIPRTSGSNQQLQSSIVIMDPYDGSIVALAGGVGEKTQNFPLNRATGTYRSPGSSFKPIASYGPAIELGYITPNTLVDDSPYIRLNGTSWFPQNDGGGNFGVVTIFQALQYSLNTVAAQIVDKIGPETSYSYLTSKLGVTSLVPADCDYAPMALGQLTNGITVREMCAAYCSFVNSGVFTYSRSYSLVTDKDGNTVLDNSPKTIQAFSPNTAYTLTYMMENAVENGTGTEANLWNMPVAGKTGTSGDYKDRWFVGCTPYYVAAVWTGYDTPERINVWGNPAAQLWNKVMSKVHDGLAPKSFTYPFIGGDTGIFGIVESTPEPDESIIDDGGSIIIGDGPVGGGDPIIDGPGDSSGGEDDGGIIIFG